MDVNKVKTILEAVQGMKRSDWLKIEHMINRQYDRMADAAVLSEKEISSAAELLALEIGEKITL